VPVVKRLNVTLLLTKKKISRFPREAEAAPSLAVFKARLDGALSSLV